MGQGNESLFIASGSHDQDGRGTTPIYGKNPLKNLLVNQRANVPGAWYAALGTPNEVEKIIIWG